MRRELKKAADKLRQKLQSLEEQIIEKQNKHTAERNNWETQRLNYVTTNNKVDFQKVQDFYAVFYHEYFNSLTLDLC